MPHAFHAFAAIAHIPLPMNNLFINPARGHIIDRGQINIQKPFIIPHILIAFRAFVQNKNLTTLGGVHGSGVNIDVGINFYGGDFKTAGLQNFADRGGRDSLADSGHNSARHKNIFCHGKFYFAVKPCS